MKIMDAETGRIVHSRDVTWHQPREPLTSPAPTVESEVPQSPSGAATPEYIYIQPAPAATTAPAAAPVPAPDNAAPAPPRNPTEPIRDRVVWNWDMRVTYVCLVARGARRERCESLRAAWV